MVEFLIPPVRICFMSRPDASKFVAELIVLGYECHVDRPTEITVVTVYEDEAVSCFQRMHNASQFNRNASITA